MPVPVVNIRVMRVRMRDRLVLVPMLVRVLDGEAWRVHVLVMLVVAVPMAVAEGRMPMRVAVVLAQVQVHARRHERPGGQ